MCKYCEEKVALIDGEYLGLALFENNHNGYNVYIRGFDKQGWDVSENSKFNYCPMCGKELGEISYQKFLNKFKPEFKDHLY